MTHDTTVQLCLLSSKSEFSLDFIPIILRPRARDGVLLTRTEGPVL